ncbi:hypothetical protein NMY22_g11840 [Coprinellus aureogranulatus]|nr:hypothetical protein NMY22_g11840 [Coprinellus aureogranulatus]
MDIQSISEVYRINAIYDYLRGIYNRHYIHAMAQLASDSGISGSISLPLSCHNRCGGKIIYLLARYIPLVPFTVGVIQSARTSAFFSLKACIALDNTLTSTPSVQRITTSVLDYLSSTVGQALIIASSDFTLSFCIYALLGAKKRFLLLVGPAYLGFCVPVFILLILQLVIEGTGAVPPTDRVRLAELEAPCTWVWPNSVKRLNAISYLYLSSVIVNTILGTAVIVARYRRQTNSLLNSIRRDGGTYFLAACLLRFIFTLFTAIGHSGSVADTPDNIFTVLGGIFLSIDLVVALVLSTGMLLNMRKIDDPGTRAIVSSIIFASAYDEPAEEDFGKQVLGLEQDPFCAEMTAQTGLDAYRASTTSDVQTIDIELNQFLTSRTTVATAVAYVYHCLTTIDVEVSMIWAKKWTIGKATYLAVRYVPLIPFAGVVVKSSRTPAFLSFGTCVGLNNTFAVGGALAVACSEFSLSFCIYALFGAKRKSLCLVGFVYLGFTVPVFVLLGLQILNEGSLELEFYRVRLAMLEGPCPIGWAESMDRLATITYLYLAGSVVNAALGMIVVVRRYRRQANSLLNSIRRDGGTYFFASCLLRFIYTLFTAIGNSVNASGSADDVFSLLGNVVLCIDLVAAPILSTGMLLNMRKIDDPGTKPIISSLMFARADNEPEDSEDGSMPEEDSQAL